MANEEIQHVDDEEFHRDMDELNKIFSQFKDDPDLDCISINRLTEVLQAFGRNPSIRDSEEKINELEEMGKFELTLDDVLQLLNEPWAVINSDRESLRQALEKFDYTNEGYIDIEHFRTVMTTLGEPLSDVELHALIQLGLNEDQTKINIEYLLDQLLGNNA